MDITAQYNEQATKAYYKKKADEVLRHGSVSPSPQVEQVVEAPTEPVNYPLTLENHLRVAATAVEQAIVIMIDKVKVLLDERRIFEAVDKLGDIQELADTKDRLNEYI